MIGNQKQSLSYIQCHEGAYIDTEYKPNTETTTFEFCAAFPEPKFFNFGSYNGDRCHAGAGNKNNLIAYFSGYDNYMQIPYDDKYHVYKIFPTGAAIDNESYNGTQRYPENLSLYIFGRNGASPLVPAGVTAYLKYAKIYENQELVRHFVPAYHNGQYCMYEWIQNKYYYNAAEVGYFTGG